MSYAQPVKGEKFSPRDNPLWAGRLFVIYPTGSEVVQFINEKTGQPEPSEIVTADVMIVDLIDPETQKPKLLLGARIGGKALVPAIRKYVGTTDAALGRLRQLPAQGAKSGAFVLDDHTDAEIALATQAEAANAGWRGGYGQPAAAAGPPTGVASPAPATTAQSVVSGSGPWFGTPEGAALLGKLVSNGVANATTFDFATAQMVGASFA